MDRFDRIRTVSTCLDHHERSDMVLMKMQHHATGLVHMFANQHRNCTLRRTMSADATPAIHQFLHSSHSGRNCNQGSCLVQYRTSHGNQEVQVARSLCSLLSLAPYSVISPSWVPCLAHSQRTALESYADHLALLPVPT